MTSTRELSDSDLLAVSERLFDENEIFKLGQKLRIKDYRIESALASSSRQSTNAAHKVLRLWLMAQDNRHSAYQILGKALVRCEMNIIARDILDYPP